MPKKERKPTQHEISRGHRFKRDRKHEGRCATCHEVSREEKSKARAAKKRRALPDAVQAPLFGGVCPKQFEKCHKCRGNKVTPMGSPSMNVQCSECQGEGVKLYPIHTMELASSAVVKEETTENGIKITTYREQWQCAKCPHAETKERAERKELDGKAVQRNG